MSVDDRDNGPGKETPPGDSTAPDDSPSPTGLKGSKEIRDALQSKTDEPLPPLAEAIAERDAQRKHPITPQGRRRRFLTRRNFLLPPSQLPSVS